MKSSSRCVVLVLLDLPSGYILVEELTENRQYSTWQVSAQQLLSSVGFSVKYFVSDRAKALVKLALNDLGCPSVADLFHALFNLSKGLGWELKSLASRLQKRLAQAHHNQAPTELIEELETEIIELQKSQETYQDCCHCLSTSLHPFAINDKLRGH